MHTAPMQNGQMQKHEMTSSEHGVKMNVYASSMFNASQITKQIKNGCATDQRQDAEMKLSLTQS